MHLLCSARLSQSMDKSAFYGQNLTASRKHREMRLRQNPGFQTLPFFEKVWVQICILIQSCGREIALCEDSGKTTVIWSHFWMQPSLLRPLSMSPGHHLHRVAWYWFGVFCIFISVAKHWLKLRGKNILSCAKAGLCWVLPLQ